jgi:hypothetical protein
VNLTNIQDQLNDWLTFPTSHDMTNNDTDEATLEEKPLKFELKRRVVNDKYKRK